jgi:hypothetical protein
VNSLNIWLADKILLCFTQSLGDLAVWFDAYLCLEAKWCFVGIRLLFWSMEIQIDWKEVTEADLW